MTPFLIQLGITLAQQAITLFTKAKVPQDLLDAASASIAAVQAHLDDLMTKADWEKLRG